jgi:hypothetical protein
MITLSLHHNGEARLVKALRYKLEVAGSITDGLIAYG